MYIIGSEMKMHRTQLFITQEQYDWLKRTAKQHGSTIAEINRKAIEYFIPRPNLLASQQTKQTLGKALREVATLAQKNGDTGPSDLASNLDRYLYK